MRLRFEWDDAKASANLAKHGVSFIAATDVFFDPDPDHVEVDATRPQDGEARREAFGTVDGQFIAVVFVIRGEVVRLISARRARPKEVGGGYSPIHSRP